MKILCLEGTGRPRCDVSKATIGNCSVRTAFHLDNGRPVYLEFSAIRRRPEEKWWPDRFKWEYNGYVRFCFYITDNAFLDDDESHSLLLNGGEAKTEDERIYQTVRYNANFEYSKEGILGFLKSIGATFDDIKVMNRGYNVFKDPEDFICIGVDCYNFGEKEMIK